MYIRAKTACSSDVECDERKLRAKSSNSSKHGSIAHSSRKNKLISLLEKGDYIQFLELWYQLFPLNERRGNSLDVLEFYIHIYLVTHPLRGTRQAKNEYKERLKALRTYLEEGAGSRMKDIPELKHYCSLLKNCDLNDTAPLKQIIETSWMDVIRQSLEVRLNEGKLRNGEEERQKADHTRESPDEFSLTEGFSKEYEDLQDDYYKMVDIASELLVCLERCSIGKKISPNYLSSLSNRLTESNMEAERRMQKSVLGKTKRSSSLKAHIDSRRRLDYATRKRNESVENLIPSDPSTRPPLPTCQYSDNGKVVEQLNFNKIKSQIAKNLNSRQSSLLLQALRQQITRSPTEAALYALGLFIEKDILMLKERKGNLMSLVVTQAEATEEMKEETARLLNVICSFRIGRDYIISISNGKDLITSAISGLKSKKLLNYSSDHILAAIQKLSVRQCIQKDLVLLGMTEWLVHFLGTSLRSFALEYGCALLLNLSLNPASHTTACRIAGPLINLLMSLLKVDNRQICKYVNGTIFVLMGVNRLCATATELGLDSVLKTKMDKRHCEDDVAQIPLILKAIRGDVKPHAYRSTSEGDQQDQHWEDGYVEAEVESTDTLRAENQELFGTNLLSAKFRMAKFEKEAQDGIQKDDLLVPPGVVPRRHPQIKLAKSTLPNKTTAFCSSSSAAAAAAVSRASRADVSNSTSNDRPFSVSSHHTFILENDTRKPLIARDVFESAVMVGTSSQQKSKADLKQSRGMSKAQARFGFGKDPTEGSSTAADDSLRSFKGQVDSANGQTIMQYQMQPSRLQNDYSPWPIGEESNDYTTVFGARPKVVRTP